jgi:thioester reductase-like protein
MPDQTWKKGETSGWLKKQIADLLNIPVDKIDPKARLTRYGMDSITAMAITALVEDALGFPVPEYLMEICSSIEELESFMLQEKIIHTNRDAEYLLEIMKRDARLSETIDPAKAEPYCQPVKNYRVLLTGATGFLGSYIAAEILKDDNARLLCLVRKDSDCPNSNGNRVQRIMEKKGLWQTGFQGRIEELPSDLALPGMGLDSNAVQLLAEQVNVIYHCAASVDWVRGYSLLKEINVEATRELLRIACLHRQKAFHFISSMGVCHILDNSQQISESSDLVPFMENIHLGYCQTKLVAELLVQEAGRRGLPVTIHRPALISGDSLSGLTNLHDVVSMMIKGCIQMGLAPDLDWEMDVLPVDFAARAIVVLSRSRRILISHLTNPFARQWREVVLWMNLFGYPVRLLPFNDWLQVFGQASSVSTHPLHTLRGFFLRHPQAEREITYAQLFEKNRNPPILSDLTNQALNSEGLHCPPLKASLLERIFRYYIRQNYLPPVERHRTNQKDSEPHSNLIRQIIDRPIQSFTLLNDLSRHSIITELTSWKYSRNCGLFRYRLDFKDGQQQSVILKMKAKDDEVLDVGQKIAAACSTELGEAFKRFGRRLGVDRCHLRELALMHQQDPRFRRYTPELFGMMRNETMGIWALALEDLARLELMNSTTRIKDWHEGHLSAALEGLADLQSIWFGREKELQQQPWFGYSFNSSSMVETVPLWTTLAVHGKNMHSDLITTEHLRILELLMDKLEEWWSPLDHHPRTLIHNDFNPRNLAFRNGKDGLRLCVYDWELAGLGVPQHDLAELLCFVIESPNKLEAMHWIELHRLALERATGIKLHHDDWIEGFRASLYNLIINRFQIYSMVHTFHHETFLPGLYSRWLKWFKIFPL